MREKKEKEKEKEKERKANRMHLMLRELLLKLDLERGCTAGPVAWRRRANRTRGPA